MTARITLLLCLLLFSSANHNGNTAAASPTTELLGVWGEGAVNALQILDDQLVLFNYGMYLKVADFSDPESPEITRKMQTMVSGIDQVLYSNGFYFAANSSERPNTTYYFSDDDVSTFRNFSGRIFSQDLRIAGDLAFSFSMRDFFVTQVPTLGGNLQWRTLEMDINRPRVIGGYDVAGDVVYVSASDKTIRLIDVSDPNSPVETLTATVEEELGGIQVVGDRLFAAFGDRRAGYYDISDPAAPALVATVGPFENFFTAGIQVAGDLLYVHARSSVVGGADELHIYDISDEENPEWINTISPGFEFFDFGVDGRSIYIAAGQFGLLHYTVDDDSTDLTSSIGGTGNISSFLQHGETAFVVTSDSSFFSVDIRNYSTPATLARLNVGSAGDLSILNDQTLVLTNGTGFELIDVTDAAAPAHLSTYESEEEEMNHVHAAVNGDNIFLFKTHVSRQTRIEVINISDPVSPALVSIFRDQSFSSTPLFPLIFGEYLLAVDRAFGGNLERYNISDPENIFFIGDMNIASLRHQQIFGNYLTGISQSNILFYDLSELPAVTHAATVPFGNDLRGLVFNGSQAITGSFESRPENSNLYTLDFSDLGEVEPDVVFSFEKFWPDFIYLAENSELLGGNSEMAVTGTFSGPGFYIYSMEQSEPTSSGEINTGVLPSEIRLEANYPNPFNPSTNIRFYLPESAEIRLSVYDITGRLVTDVVNGHYSAGVHSIAFDGAGISSGVYVYRLEAGETVMTRRMTLVK